MVVGSQIQLLAEAAKAHPAVQIEPGDRFEKLLNLLASEHHRQVADLREQIQQLKLGTGALSDEHGNTPLLRGTGRKLSRRFSGTSLDWHQGPGPSSRRPSNSTLGSRRPSLHSVNSRGGVEATRLHSRCTTSGVESDHDASDGMTGKSSGHSSADSETLSCRMPSTGPKNSSAKGGQGPSQGSHRVVRFTRTSPRVEVVTDPATFPEPPGVLEPPLPPADLPPAMRATKSGGNEDKHITLNLRRCMTDHADGEAVRQETDELPITQTNSLPELRIRTSPVESPGARRLQAVSAKIVTANKFSMGRLLQPVKPSLKAMKSKSRSMCNDEPNVDQGATPNGEMRTSNTCSTTDVLANDYQDLGLRNAFKREAERTLSQRRLTSVRTLTVTTVPSQRHEENLTVVAYDGFLRYFIATPTSTRRIIWESAGAALIGFDLLFVPLSIVFQPPEEDWMFAMNWASLIYWTINIPATLFVGVIVDGILIMDPSKILMNYCKTWLGIDLLVVIPEWIFTTMSVKDTRGGRFVKLLRIWRLFRTTRLLRVLRLRWILEVLNDLLQTELLGITVNICKMMCLMFLICHYTGCAWYLLGEATVDARGGSWVVDLDTDWRSLYLTSVHWSMSQFTPASMEVHPRNIVERGFTVLMVMFALVCFSYVVGSITASLSQLRSMNEDFAKQSWIARRYLRQHDVPTHLSIRIMRYLEKRYERQRSHVHMENIKIFALLSEYLHNELQSAVYLPSLRHHPILYYMLALSPTTMQRLAAKAMSRTWLAGGDYFFIPADKPNHMGVLVHGKLLYVKVDSCNIANESFIEKERDCILEPVLWTNEWVCLGEASAVTDCEIQLLSADYFEEIVSASPQLRQVTSSYGQVFMDAVNKKSYDEVQDFWRGEDIVDLANTIIQDFEAAQPPAQKALQVSTATKVGKALSKSISFARFTKEGKGDGSKSSLLSRMMQK